MSSKRGELSGSLSLGLALVGLSCAALFFTKDISRTGLAGNGDPGPQFFPILLSLCLLVGGVWEISVWIARRYFYRFARQRRSWSLIVKTALANRGGAESLVMVIVLGATIWSIGDRVAPSGEVIPGLSFSLSMFIFSSVSMTMLGFPAIRARMAPGSASSWRNTKWWIALVVSLVTSLLASCLLVATIELLFVQLFKVQLPEGTFGLPF